MSRVLDLLTPAHGHCHLSFVSATSLKLSPYGGQLLNINGLPSVIPAAGVTVSNAGLANSTTYFVYAAMSGTSMTLELSTTGHSTHTTGIEIKTGDVTRTLVGMARTTAAGEFADAYARRFVLSWFNRRDLAGISPTTIGSVSSTAALAEINTAGRVEFLSWADEAADAVVVGSVSNSAAGNSLHTTSPGIDGAGGAQTTATTYAASINMPVYGRYLLNVAEGYHFASAYGQVNQGLGTWNFGVQVKTRG